MWKCSALLKDCKARKNYNVQLSDRLAAIGNTWDQLKAPLKPLETSQHYSIEGFNGRPDADERDASLSGKNKADVFFPV